MTRNVTKSRCFSWSILAIFWKPEAQTVLPDMSVLIGQKLVEKANIQMVHFQGIKVSDFILK